MALGGHCTQTVGHSWGQAQVIPASITCLLAPKWEPIPTETGKLPQHQLGTGSTGGRKSFINLSAQERQKLENY